MCQRWGKCNELVVTALYRKNYANSFACRSRTAYVSATNGSICTKGHCVLACDFDCSQKGDPRVSEALFVEYPLLDFGPIDEDIGSYRRTWSEALILTKLLESDADVLLFFICSMPARRRVLFTLGVIRWKVFMEVDRGTMDLNLGRHDQYGDGVSRPGFFFEGVCTVDGYLKLFSQCVEGHTR